MTRKKKIFSVSLWLKTHNNQPMDDPCCRTFIMILTKISGDLDTDKPLNKWFHLFHHWKPIHFATTQWTGERFQKASIYICKKFEGIEIMMKTTIWAIHSVGPKNTAMAWIILPHQSISIFSKHILNVHLCIYVCITLYRSN